MKKWFLVFLVFSLMVGTISVFLQSKMFHQHVLARLNNLSEELGWKVTVEKTKGTFPFTFHLENVDVSGNGMNYSIDHVDGKISPIGLLRGTIRFQKLDVGTVTVVSNDEKNVNEGFSLPKKIVIPVSIKDFHIDQICFDQECIKNANGSFQLTENKTKGKVFFTFWDHPFFLKGSWNGSSGNLQVGDTTFSLRQDHFFHIENEEGAWSLNSNKISYLSKTSTIEVERNGNVVHGNFNLQNLHEWNNDTYGTAVGDFHGDINGISLNAHLQNVYFKNIHSENIQLELIQNKFHAIGTNFGWDSFHLDHFTLNAEKDGNWHFSLQSDGSWKHPLHLEMMGAYKQGELEISQFTGTFYNHPFNLQNPVLINPSQIGPLSLQVDLGRLDLTWEKKETITLTVDAKEIPLDLLSLNPLEVDVSGTLDLTLHLEQVEEDLFGKWVLDIKNLQVDTPLVFQTEGTISGSVRDDLIQTTGSFGWEGKKFLFFDFMLPMHVSLSPLDVKVHYSEPVAATFDYEGNVEEVLDFFNFGMHRIAGKLACHFTLKGTLASPELNGMAQVSNGSYENYLTGVHVVGIQGRVYGKKDHLDIAFSGNDFYESGTIKGDGTLLFHLKEKFPYYVQLTLDRFDVTQVDLVKGEANGKVILYGDANEAHLKGNIAFQKSQIHIPSHIPKLLPDLTVVYVNASHPTPEPVKPSSFSFPLHLDIELTTPGGIDIEGKGLTSEWNGNVRLTGTYEELLTTGKIELVNGEFVFGGRSFKLDEGSLVFRGKPHEMPRINLIGNVKVKDIIISVRLKGPLNRPEVTFQSDPPLPMSSIISYLLFGQEVSEINSFQALQLATTIASFSADTLDVMEKTRRALGVDKLEIVSIPDATGVEETIALQVGKYISEGVLVTFTQGPEDSARNISIEVEMPHGLVLQLENDQRQEQGKFTLKWNYNY